LLSVIEFLFTPRHNARIAVRCKKKFNNTAYTANSAVLAIAIPSVCPSVCPSVTRRYCVKTTAHSTVQFALMDGKMCLVL